MFPAPHLIGHQGSFDSGHVIYVWLDALSNYITALGYGEDNGLLSGTAADVHLIGKDIFDFIPSTGRSS